MKNDKESFLKDIVKPFLLMGGALLLALSQNSWADMVKKADELPSASSQDVISYKTYFQETSKPEIDQSLKDVSQLLALEKTRSVGAYALAGRIRAEYDTLKAVLRSYGYYRGLIEIKIRSQEENAGTSDHVTAEIKGEISGDDPFLAEKLKKISQKNNHISLHISAKLGPIFHIRHFLFLPPLDQDREKEGKKEMPQKEEFTFSPAEKEAFKIKEGDVASAADILAAQARLSTAMQEEGYGLSTLSEPQVILQKTENTLDVRFYAAHGPKLVIGPISFKKQDAVKEDYLRRRLSLKQGQLYQPSAIENARIDLNNRGVFSSVEVRNNPPLEKIIVKDKEGKEETLEAMPLRFKLSDGKRHNISGDIGYSTDLGGRAGVSWLDRNLLGRAESLKVSILATGLGGTSQQGLGYDIFADFNKPDFMVRDRLLNLHAEAVRQLLYSYHQTAWLFRGGFSQPLTQEWSFGGAASLEEEQIRQFGTTRNYFILSIPLQLTYDTTKRKNPIEPATHGVRVNLGLTPSESLQHKSSSFVIMNAQISSYFDLGKIGLGKKGNSILALRGLVGSIQGETTWNIPPDQRFYAGGPATVRGYRYQGVGSQRGKYAIGGTSIDTATIELRQRVYHNIGMAIFSDAGQVGTNSTPGHGKLRVGYGAGLRYFTPIGPVRVDVALPTKRPQCGDKWELYVGLGETF